MCPAGSTAVGGGCDAQKSPHRFEYNGPVVEGELTGWKCGGSGAKKKVKVACMPDPPALTTPAPPPLGAVNPFGPLLPGSVVAFHSKIHDRFVRMNGNGNMDGSDHKGMDELPPDWTWERFKVVDAGNDEIALWSEIHHRFIRMHSNGNMDVSDTKGVDELPGDWTWERFQVVDGGNGEWALWSKVHNRFMRLHADGNMDGSGHKGKDELPHDWTWERFNVVVVQAPGYTPPPVQNPFLPGSVVALHSKIHGRFVRMNANGNMDGSGHKGIDELPPDWTWERFHIVDAGNGEIALWSEIHHRYIRMHSNGNMDVSDQKGVDELPGDWTWERFEVVDAGYGEWALWSKIHNRFMRLHADGNMDGSGHKGKDELPHDWTWERFNVVTVMPPGVPPPAEPSPFQPGSVVALHSKVHGRFVRMNADGNMDGSGHKGIDELPSDWTWERFKVVDAGRNEIAFWSEIHNRYIRMNSNGNMDFSDPKGIDELPDDWTWERFEVVDAGYGEWALWSKVHNRFMRLHADGNMDGSGHKGKNELPHDWTWERFNVLVVNPPPPPAPPPLVECIPQAGDGTGGTEEYMLDTATMQECAEYVVENRPAANAATWGRTTNKCYAEMDQSAVHPHNEWVNCYVSADGTSVTCNPHAGDGTGGTDEYLLDTPTMQACAEYVAQHRPEANAATWGRTTNKCYAEMGQSGVLSSTEWTNCYIGGYVAPPPTTPAPAAPPASTCDYVAYCNLYPDLADAFCGGGPCTAAHAGECANHWNQWGQGEGRECPPELPPTAAEAAPMPIVPLVPTTTTTTTTTSSAVVPRSVSVATLSAQLQDTLADLRRLQNESALAWELAGELKHTHILLDAEIPTAMQHVEGTTIRLNSQFDGTTLESAHSAAGALANVEARVHAFDMQGLVDAEASMAVFARRAHDGAVLTAANIQRTLS
jgi:hypothetical protein